MGNQELPAVPDSRAERYLAALSGQEVPLPQVPESRVEQYLAWLVQHGVSGGGGASGDDLESTATEEDIQGVLGDVWSEGGGPHSTGGGPADEDTATDEDIENILGQLFKD